MAVLGESGLVSLAIMSCGVTSGTLTPTAPSSSAGNSSIPVHQNYHQPNADPPFATQALAHDLEKQWAVRDPVLFPYDAADDVLRLWPPVIGITAEFDQYRASSEAFHSRLAKSGRLLESICYPGCNHAFMCNLRYN